MNWDFRTAEELLKLCAYKYMDISDIMLAREMQLGELEVAIDGRLPRRRGSEAERA